MERVEKIKKFKKPSDTKATTTHLVHKIIGSVFADQMEVRTCSGAKKKRCGTCAGCQQPNCGLCTVCVHMGKPGQNEKILLGCLMRV